MKYDEIYLAGFFDGEGSITLNKRRRGKYIEYIPHIAIGQNDGATLDWIKKNFGGNIHKVKRDGSFWWYATNKNALNVLERILPYLKYKSPQATTLLSIRTDKRMSPLPSEEINRREKILSDLKNQKKIFSEALLCSSNAGSTTKRVNPKGMQ